MTEMILLVVYLTGVIVAYGTGIGSQYAEFGDVLGIRRVDITLFSLMSLFSWFSVAVLLLVYPRKGFMLSLRRKYPGNSAYKPLYIRDEGEI